MSYATVADLLVRKDYGLIADLCQDVGERPSREDLLDDVNTQAALDDASADIDAALLVGNRYTEVDLSGLTGNALSLLKRICCDIAMTYLYDRRPIHNVDEYQRYTELKQAHLKRLQTGENVFNLTAQKDAGLPTLDGPTNVDYQRMNLIPERTPNLYPRRSTRLPTDRG